jgi:hypothetical protein
MPSALLKQTLISLELLTPENLQGCGTIQLTQINVNYKHFRIYMHNSKTEGTRNSLLKEYGRVH